MKTHGLSENGDHPWVGMVTYYDRGLSEPLKYGLHSTNRRAYV